MQYPYSLPLDSAGETAALVAHDGVDALLDVEQRLGVKGDQRNCRRQQSSMRARYVAGESGIANFALGVVVSRRAPHAARSTPSTEHRMQGLGMHIFHKHSNIAL